MQLPIRKMSIMLVLLAATGCFQDVNAQQPMTWEPSARKLELKNIVKLGNVYIPSVNASSPTEPGTYVLELGGQRSFWELNTRTIIQNYLGSKLDVRYLAGHEAKPPFLSLIKDGAHKEFRKEDFPEKELINLTRTYPSQVKKLREGELTVEMIATWLYKFGDGMLPETKTLPDATDADFKLALSSDAKPVQFVFYRSKKTLAEDPTLPTEALREKAWADQEKQMRECAGNAVTYHGMLRIRKLATDQIISGRNLYDWVAPDSWEGQPVVVLFWGNPVRSACERWGPFKPTQAVHGRAYGDDIGKQVLFCLGLDAALSQQALKNAGAALPAPGSTVTPALPGTPQPRHENSAPPKKNK